ncbi:MAG: alginate export family protein [Flavobacterium sp.]|nr:alginate export family protein [Flavobacterium sp.]
MKKTYLKIAFFALMTQFANAQFSLDGEFRPRTEFRHGFGNLIPDDTDAGFGTSTRVRLNAGYKADEYQFYLSIQDVYTWGENRQLLPQDVNNSFGVFEAWVDYKISNNWSTKLGRQTIDYDDERILGSVGWVQQARNHDAALIKYRKDKFMLDLAFAFNQDKADISGFSSVGTDFNTAGFFTYKAMQYAYLKKEWTTFSASFLALNTTFQDLVGGVSAGTTSSLVTTGTHLAYKKDKFGLESNIFYQTGERQNEIKANAYLASLDLSYKATAKVVLGLGAEIISGQKDDTAAFFPLYGTNHKFNGLMDYFYVGNHANSIGLVDLHANAKFIFSEKSNLSVSFLNFSGAEALPSGEKSLGNEIDLVFATKLKGAGLAIGYSQLFANDGMYELKGTTKEASSNLQNWAWVMLTIKPKFLN